MPSDADRDFRQRARDGNWLPDPESKDGFALHNYAEFATLGARAAAEPPEYQWLVENWIPRIGVTNYSGHGESGKTYTMLDLMLCALMGRKWLGVETREIKSACFLTAEQSLNNVDLRLDRLLRRYGYEGKPAENGGQPGSTPRAQFTREVLEPQEKSFVYWSTREDEIDQPFWHFSKPYEFPIQEREGRMLEETTTYWFQIEEWLADLKCELFIVDSITHFYHDSINDKAKVLWILKQLGRAAERLQCAIVFLYHPSMSGLQATGALEGMGGAMEWFNQVDAHMVLRYDRETEERSLRQKKSREGAPQPDLDLKWDGHGFAREGAGDRPDGFKIAESIIADCNASGLVLSMSPYSKTYYPRVMWAHPLNRRGKRKLISGKGTEEAWAPFENLVAELRKQGKAEVGDVKTASRHAAKGLRLTTLSGHYQDNPTVKDQGAEFPF